MIVGGTLMSQSIVVSRGWRTWVVAVRLSGTLALAGTMQLAQAQQTSTEIAFRSKTWNALHTELGRGLPPVGWAFVMTRNGQEIFVDQGASAERRGNLRMHRYRLQLIPKCSLPA